MAEFRMTIENMWSNDGTFETIAARPEQLTPTKVKGRSNLPEISAFKLLKFGNIVARLICHISVIIIFMKFQVSHMMCLEGLRWKFS